jgi:hypothetical protein
VEPFLEGEADSPNIAAPAYKRWTPLPGRGGLKKLFDLSWPCPIVHSRLAIQLSVVLEEDQAQRPRYLIEIDDIEDALLMMPKASLPIARRPTVVCANLRP